MASPPTKGGRIVRTVHRVPETLDTPGNDVRSMSDLLTARPPSSSTSLLSARDIIDKLSTSSTCSQEIASRLLRQCKPGRLQQQNSQSELQKENAQAAYALCEERQVRVRTSASRPRFEFDTGRPLDGGSLGISSVEDELTSTEEVVDNSMSLGER